MIRFLTSIRDEKTLEKHDLFARFHISFSKLEFYQKTGI